MASWLLRQGTAAGAVNATHDDAAYSRLRPDIERGDPLFLAKVAEFQALLDSLGQSIRGVVQTAGFTPLEQLLLIALPSPHANTDLYSLQHKQRWWYYRGLQKMGLDREEPPAVQLALCWFGAPFSSLALDDADADLDLDDDDDDDGNSLQFLDKYSLCDYRGILFNLVEDSYEDHHEDHHKDQTRPRSDQLDHYLHRLQKRYPLRGGAAAPNKNTIPTKSKVVRLHGFQGAVNFDIYNQDSLADAVARLMGPTTKVTFALYTVAPQLASNGKPCAARGQPPRVHLAGRSYSFRHIQDWFATDGAEHTLALFVCALDEQPPAAQWLPYDGDPAYSETVVYCARTAASNSNYAAAWHEGDEAYLRLPLNAEDLSPNHYFEWMLVVARILTPGAGLDALNRNESGVLARSHVGLCKNRNRNSDPVLFDPKTPAGLSFSPRAWEMLVCDAMDAWAEKKPARAEFDVVPVGKDMISVYLPGIGFETAPISAAAFTHPASCDDPYNVKRGAPFRRDLAAKVHQLLQEALTADEHDQLDCVNIWPDGRFWHDRPISVALGDSGDAHKGFEDRWVVRDLQSYLRTVPSAAVIRPVYQSYTAILSDNVSVAMGSHDTLDEFRDRLRRANVAGLDPDTDHLFIRQTATSYNIYPELNPDMTEAQRKQANRPGFFLSPQSTDEEWQLVRSQIISPTIWISHADMGAALRPPVLPLKWGFRETYGNMLDVAARTTHDRLLDEYWETALRMLEKGDNDDGDGVEDEDEDEDDNKNEDGPQHFEHLDSSAPQHTLGQSEAQLDVDDAHSLIYTVPDPEKGKLAETAPLQEEEGEATRTRADYQEPETRSGLATPPSSASKTAKRKRHNGKSARHVDPSYRPDQDEHDTDDDLSIPDNHGSSSGSQFGSRSTAADKAAKKSAKKAGRAAKRRKTAEKDSIYRPQQDGDKADDDDNLPTDVADDSLDGLDSPVKKTAPKKRKRGVDSSYRPGSEETDEDVVVDGTPGQKAKKKKTGLNDPSFRPKEPTGQLYVDDQDEELRQSAVPEWEWDPADPAGKRKRVIREKSTGPVKTANTAKTTKAKSVSRAVTPAQDTPLKTGIRGTPPTAEGTRRSGRSRQPPQRLSM